MATNDPFSLGTSVPSLSFAEVGTVHTVEVSTIDPEVQQRDFATGEPLTWPDGSAKKIVVIQGLEGSETVSLWVQPSKAPGSLFQAISDAQRVAGKVLEPGDKLTVQFSDTTPAKTKGFNPRKIYKAKIEAGTSAADAFERAPW